MCDITLQNERERERAKLPVATEAVHIAAATADEKNASERWPLCMM
jgi:hypothetical protein